MKLKKSKGKEKTTTMLESKNALKMKKELASRRIPSISAVAQRCIRALPRIGRFIWQALIVIFLLSVIFSMIAIPLLVVFG